VPAATAPVQTSAKLSARRASVRLFLALALCALAQGAAAQIQYETITSGGYERSYALYSPDGSDTPKPLVLVLHGAGGDAVHMMQISRGSWNRIAQDEGWLVAYPEAIDTMWDTGGGIISERLARRTDDPTFLAAVIDDIAARHPVDPSRIFLTGFSRGAQTSFVVACRLEGRIRAIASVAMAMPVHVAPGCESGPPVGIMMITGHADPFVPPETGPIYFLGQERDTMLSPQDAAAHWRPRNGCPEAPTSDVKINAYSFDGNTATRTEWATCEGAPIVNIRINPGDHAWPDTVRAGIFSAKSREIDATAEAFRFFSSFASRR